MARTGSLIRSALRGGRPLRRGGWRGFTLVELLVSLVVVAILASIAIPSYSAYIVRGQRAAAKSALEQVAQFLERNYTVSGCYDFTNAASCTARGAAAGGGPVAIPIPYAPTDGQVTYAIALGPLPAGALAGQGFSVTATPCGTAGTCPAGSKTAFADADCGALTLDNTGTKGAGGTIGAADPASCWGR